MGLVKHSAFGAINRLLVFFVIDASRGLLHASSLSFYRCFGESNIGASVGVCATTHNRAERLGSHARRYRDGEVAGCVQEVSARRLSPREADSSRRTRPASSSSVGSHGRVRASISMCAVQRQFRLARRQLAVASHALAPCYNVCMYVCIYVCMYVCMYETKFCPRHNGWTELTELI